MPTLNIADLALGIIWLFFTFRGYMRGLVKEVGSLAAIATGFYCAGTYHKALAPRLAEVISGNYAATAAYLIIFTVALIAVWFIALAVSGIVKITMTQWADRFFGGGFGLVKGVILTAVLLFLIHLATPNPDFLKGSTLVPVLERVSTRLVQYIPSDIHEKLRAFGKKNLPDLPRPGEDKKSADKPAPEKKKTEQAKAEPEKKPAEPAKAEPERKQAEAEKKAPETAKPEAGKKLPELPRPEPENAAEPETAKSAPEPRKTEPARTEAKKAAQPAQAAVPKTDDEAKAAAPKATPAADSGKRHE